MDIVILGPLPKTTLGNQHVIIIADLYSKLTSTIITGKLSSSPLVNVFLDNWTLLHGIPTNVETDKGPQIVSKFFRTLCLVLGAKKLITTAYHPQTYDQVERYSFTLVARLGHYVSNNQKDRDTYIQPLTYA